MTSLFSVVVFTYDDYQLTSLRPVKAATVSYNVTSICVWKYVLKIKKSRDHKTESVSHLIVHDVR